MKKIQDDFTWRNKIKTITHDQDSLEFIYSALIVIPKREREWALKNSLFYYLAAGEKLQGAAIHSKVLRGRHLIFLNEARLLDHARKCGARNKGKGLYSKDADWHFLERLASVIFHEIMHLKLGHKGGSDAKRNSHECKVQFLEWKNRRKLRRTMEEMPWVWINHKSLQKGAR